MPNPGKGPIVEAVTKNDFLVHKLNALVTKQQLLLNKVYDSDVKKRQISGTTDNLQTSLRAKPTTTPQGCKITLWKQDPSVKEVPIRAIFLPGTVEEGPADKHIRILPDQKQKDMIAPSFNGDLVMDFDKDPYAFDACHVYACVRMVLNMYSRDLQTDWRWQWDTNPGPERIPINVMCHAGVKMNAAYLRSKKLMKFYFFNNPNDKSEVCLCRSLDIVAHETGHAVLDALKPDLYSIKKGQQGAFHEAFADLTTMFAILSQFDLCEDIVANTKSDLRTNRYLSAIGEQFAESMQIKEEDDDDDVHGDPDERGEDHNSIGRGMRDCNNTLKGSEVKDMYDIGQVFVGFMFDILCDVYQHERNPDFMDDAECLYETAANLRRAFLLAVKEAPATPNFTDVAKALVKAIATVAADNVLDLPYWKQAIVKYQTDRELVDAGNEGDRRKPMLDLDDF